MSFCYMLSIFSPNIGNPHTGACSYVYGADKEAELRKVN